MKQKLSTSGLGIVGLSVALAIGACSQKSGDPASTPAPPVTDVAPATTPSMSASSIARQKAPDGAKVSFSGIKDGDTVTSPFKVGFASENLKIAPAGTSDPGTGHYHLIIDSELPPQDAPLPATDLIKHYGKAQTEDELSLTPGKHTLQIEVADGAHVPFDPAIVSDKITVTVK